jgi:uncharacterized delta-60 repeat protein
MKKYFAAFALTVFANSVLLSQTTTVFDYSFGGDGIVTAAPGPNNDGKSSDILLQPDGKILVAGKTLQPTSEEDFLLLRYNTNGTPDNTFGTGGVVITAVSNAAEGIGDILLQPDGKILALGYNGMTGSTCVVRYNSDGSLDNTFGTGGIVNWDLTGVRQIQIPGDLVLQSNGKIIVGVTTFGDPIYNSDIALGRLNSNGTIDNTYGFGGIVLHHLSFDFDILSDMDIQAGGKVIAVGYIQNLAGNSYIFSTLLDNDGIYDAAYDGGLILDTISSIQSDNVNCVLVQPDGKVLMGGTTGESFASKYLLIRYNSNGTRDNTFGTNGVVTQTFNAESRYLQDMLLMPNGKILVVGKDQSGTDTHFARFNTNGTLDNSFNSGGHAEVDITLGAGITDDMRAIAIQTDGKILTTGYCDACTTGTATTARFVNNMVPVVIIGINDYVFSATETLVYPNPLQAIETLKYTLTDNETISINLVDSQGKLVAEFVKNEARNKGDNTEVLTLPENLLNGTYFIEIASHKGKVSIKVVK